MSILIYFLGPPQNLSSKIPVLLVRFSPQQYFMLKWEFWTWQTTQDNKILGREKALGRKGQNEVMGEIKQWGGKWGWHINPSRVSALLETWFWTSPILGFSSAGAPAVRSCLCPTGTQGWERWGAGGTTRWNCSCSPCIRRRWCLVGGCHHPAFRRSLAGCSASATSALLFLPIDVSRSNAVLILGAKVEIVGMAPPSVNYVIISTVDLVIHHHELICDINLSTVICYVYFKINFLSTISSWRAGNTVVSLFVHSIAMIT